MLRSFAMDDRAGTQSIDAGAGAQSIDAGAGALGLDEALLTDSDAAASTADETFFENRHAVIFGCSGEPLQQLLLMLEVMDWTCDLIDTPEAFDDTAIRARTGADLRLLFIDAKLAATVGFAIDRARTVVFLGRAPAHGRALYTGKSIIWLQTPLDMLKLERVIENAA